MHALVTITLDTYRNALPSLAKEAAAKLNALLGGAVSHRPQFRPLTGARGGHLPGESACVRPELRIPAVA